MKTTVSNLKAFSLICAISLCTIIAVFSCSRKADEATPLKQDTFEAKAAPILTYPDPLIKPDRKYTIDAFGTFLLEDNVIVELTPNNPSYNPENMPTALFYDNFSVANETSQNLIAQGAPCVTLFKVTNPETNAIEYVVMLALDESDCW